MSEQIENQQKPKSKKTFYLLILVFILPFTMAVLMHLFDIKPGGKSYGDLVQPPKNLVFPVLTDTEGKPFKPEQWNKIWSVVMVDATGCQLRCQHQLHMLKQVQTSLNKDKDRVQRVLLVPADTGLQAYADLKQKYPELIILAGANADMLKFAAEFDTKQGQIFLVDPLGNLMMRYPGKVEPKGVRKDLMRLLKNSWAG